MSTLDGYRTSSEIVDGISENDQIILQPDPSIADGTAVQVESVSTLPQPSTPKDGGIIARALLSIKCDGIQSTTGSCQQ